MVSLRALKGFLFLKGSVFRDSKVLSLRVRKRVLFFKVHRGFLKVRFQGSYKGLFLTKSFCKAPMRV